MQVLYEAAVVGAVTAIALAIMLAFITPTTTLHRLVTGFVLGVCMHLLFEMTGANMWYCKHGAVCIVTK